MISDFRSGIMYFFRFEHSTLFFQVWFPQLRLIYAPCAYRFCYCPWTSGIDHRIGYTWYHQDDWSKIPPTGASMLLFLFHPFFYWLPCRFQYWCFCQSCWPISEKAAQPVMIGWFTAWFVLPNYRNEFIPMNHLSPVLLPCYIDMAARYCMHAHFPLTSLTFAWYRFATALPFIYQPFKSLFLSLKLSAFQVRLKELQKYFRTRTFSCGNILTGCDATQYKAITQRHPW